MSRAALEAFAKAAEGGPAYPIPYDQMIHGVAVTEAIVRAAASEKVEKVLQINASSLTRSRAPKMRLELEAMDWPGPIRPCEAHYGSHLRVTDNNESRKRKTWISVTASAI